MNRDQKTTEIEALKEKVGQYDTIYITDASTLTVDNINKFRRLCFEKGIKFEVVKNTLLKKAFEAHGDKYEKLAEVLHGPTSIMLSESAKDPAKVIKQFRKENDKKMPLLKGAYIASDVFVGDENLDMLIAMKGKQELIGEIIGILQSPAKNVISGLLSSQHKLAGIVKTLSERDENS